ncbi:hypothetical protein PtrSN002B_008117 [Pyrenophora tritici-repentis]|uniref:Herpes-BLLF1 multi-domain protein n=2 Tax=Pyrenophora tritici-repentis TaxID=45151 RepID=A0A2W1EMP5_9PLEO|nr:uncharacterized protein PTRG_01591 [Pyrenophora tritici-repentis Pt-1C-BFP]KAA8626254.1 Herpes-BLLF1 multi-domain protein [Pyrenophora tritici-repentis]EDU41029.1 predicted protein [Pyrenophora tritici-repentis Pt-1C-BFP]KAF7454667.1 Herpes-BLLF1 multi-domain protein [Pyrenophora tritici-repentis]KAF7577792.1 Herpes-BLLF1 multi-domain protein [Pyrenophora tritici-repentis]KAG9388424.1 Herpes-BLLF1 multi-domain protein [Pyrenophora tritici-repentis]
MVRQFTFLPTDRRATGDDGRSMKYSHWGRYNTFYGLSLTTTLSTILLLAQLYEWRVTGQLFALANKFPGSAALVVQLLAASFGLLHLAVICKLFNYALRIRLARVSVSLDVLRTWVFMTLMKVDWDLPLRFFFPVLFTAFLSLVPAALWAGAMTASVSTTVQGGSLLIPSFEDVSLIKEYPMMIGSAGPSLRTQKGFFTYSVGQQQSGQILAAAAEASSGLEPHIHRKPDNTQFSYLGRSYGVGAAVGLMDQSITSNTYAAGYIYEEMGYLANVTCSYNRTSDFTLSGPVNEWIYAASGNLPDSEEGPEYSNYIGHDGKAIVAIGVAFSERSPRRYLSIAAGEAYAFLNNTQCEFDFTPTLFNITVDIGSLNITVTPVKTVPDFNPERNITRTVLRQFELMSNDMTNLYVSLLGEAFNSSIAAYRMSRASQNLSATTEEEGVMHAVSESMISMADTMLVAYASAQLMVGKMSVQKPAEVHIYALKFGQPIYIYAIFTFNLLVICAVAFEAMRTSGWSGLGRFNYLDPRDLIIAASRGGADIASAADDIMERREGRRMKHLWLLSDPDVGNGSLIVNLKGDDDGHVKINVGSRQEGDGAATPDSQYPVDEKSSYFEFGDAMASVPLTPKTPAKIKVGIFGSHLPGQGRG